MSVTVTQPAHLISVGATLGEGAVWDGRSQALWFVDIVSRSIHRFDPDTATHRRWQAPEKIGFIYPAISGMIVGLAKGLHRFDPPSASFTLLQGIEGDLARNRLNDGGLAPDGTLWFGTMDDDERATSGRFYRYDGTGVAAAALDPMAVTNGPAISPDGRTLYAVDTLNRRVLACALDHGAFSDVRTFAEFSSDQGYPDGATCDADGGVWLGFWGGAAARRFDEAGGQTDEVRFPVPNVTKVAIGGPDGKTAYATTARKGLSTSELASHPLSGDVFTFPVSVPGVTAPLALLPQ